MKVHYRQDYTPSPYQILSTSLVFDLQEHETLVTNTMEIVRAKGVKARTPLVLNGEEQELFTLKMNGQDLTQKDYDWTETELTILNPPERFSLTTVSRIHPESNTKLEGLYKSKGMFCTQCEPHGFRRITFYLDRPDVMALFTTKIIADKALYPVLLSNGNLIEQGEAGPHRHYAIWQDPFKKPCYLFAVVAGNLECVRDVFVTQSGRSVRVEVYSDALSISQCGYALTAMKEAMAWDELRFGREYDLDVYMIVAAEDFNMGAMENKGLNIFNTKFVLADPTLSTDMDYQNIQAVIGHEYFHNWTGNRVTCRDWFQLSLKEGLTVFRDAEFTADHHDRTLKRIEDANFMRSHQFAEDGSPMAHPIRPDSYIEMNNFYTATVYEKGCEVIRMIHTLLGEAGFRKGMDLYFERHDGQAVTCDDFVAAMADANHYDFELFKNWYSTAGTPEVHVTSQYDAAKQTYTLHFKQSGHFHIPIKLGLVPSTPPSSAREEEKQHQLVFSLKTKEDTLIFDNVTAEPIPSLLRDFSAPVKLFYDYSLEELNLLWQHDPNLFNRWDAGQRLMTEVILHNKPFDPQSMKKILTEAMDYPGLTAELLSVPNIKSLGEMVKELNPEHLISAHSKLLHRMSHGLLTQFQQLYKKTLESAALDPQKASLRALKNICLFYLCQAGEYAEAAQQYDTASNMTERFGALTALVNAEAGHLKTERLAHFYETYKAHPLVVNKWFAVQAGSRSKDTLATVETLLSHPAFIRSNPNKVYALMQSFGQNFYAFHSQGGKGYALLGQFINELDSINSLVSARLVKNMMNFKQYHEPHRSIMKQQLSLLQQKSDLSKDVREIVEKALF